MGFSPEVRAGSHAIGREHAPFVIAEMSGNHNGDLDRALAIVDAVADSGAQALKIQTYTADTITLDADGPAFRVEEELYGDAILTSLPERLVQAAPLPGYDSWSSVVEPRGALWLAVDVGGGVEVQIINTHLGLVPKEQQIQAAWLAGDLARDLCRDLGLEFRAWESGSTDPWHPGKLGRLPQLEQRRVR